MLLQYAGLIFLLFCTRPSAGGGATNDGEKAMQQLETAEGKLEQKLASMMSELGTQLKQAEETQLPLKRKKRQAKKSEEDVDVAEPPPPPPKRAGVNPMAKYSLEDFVGVLKSMRQLRKAFDNLMESYRVYKNNQEEEQADKVKADIEDEDEEKDEEKDDEKDEEKDEDEEGDKSEDEEGDESEEDDE